MNIKPNLFAFRFLFSDDVHGGLLDYEGALSSSFIAGGSTYKTEKFLHEYKLSYDGLRSPKEFIIQFERELPKAKFMKVYTRMEFLNSDVNAQYGYKILIKGTLNKQTNTLQQKILAERRT